MHHYPVSDATDRIGGRLLHYMDTNGSTRTLNAMMLGQMSFH